MTNIFKPYKKCIKILSCRHVHIIIMEISFRYLAYIICRKKTLRAMVIKLERFSKAKCTPALLAEHKIMIQIISKNWLNNFCQNHCMCLIKPVL